MSQKLSVCGIVLIGYAALWLWLCAACPYRDVRLDDANWCEAWTIGEGCLRQPWNSISNITFLMAAAAILHTTGVSFSYGFYLSVLLTYTCFASTLFHASGGGVYPFGLMDVASVIAVMWVLLAMVCGTLLRILRLIDDPEGLWPLIWTWIGLVLAHTIDDIPWIEWIGGWHVLLIIYMAIMTLFGLTLCLIVSLTVYRFRFAWKHMCGYLLLGLIALVGIIMLSLNSYDGLQTHCALGDMGHGIVQALQALGVYVVWRITFYADTLSTPQTRVYYY
jgi:hypothetical protein